MGKKKLLYIMGIDWQWIFQRPQIIGQHLEKNYDVTVVFPRSILKWRPRRSAGGYPGQFKILWTLPFQEKNSLLGFLSRLMAQPFFRKVDRYDGIVIGYPLYYRYIPPDYGGKIIYDCMDNYETIYPYRKGVETLLLIEKALVLRCDALVASCRKLYDKMADYTDGKGIIGRVIRNGTFLDIAVEPQGEKLPQRTYKVGYFGTLAEWFDYSLLERSLNENKDIEYHLIGPYRQETPSSHPGLVYEGIVPHDELCRKTEDYVCLVMPFIVNDIVEWVDPVKLYEYIALGKCVVSVYYDEIRRFEDYVYFYRTAEDYVELMETLKRKQFPPKYTARQQREFLQDNSWDVRLREWDELLHSLAL